MEFVKMHGLGNDFILFYFENGLPTKTASHLALTLCDRYRGIGADGLVFITSSDSADVKMHIFNADGNEAEQCGNAIRCVAKYAQKRLNIKKETMTIETRRGAQRVWMLENGEVCVDMGPPILEARQIPVDVELDQVVHYPLEFKSERFNMTCVSMGNPHAVIEASDVSRVPIDVWGPQIENHPLFPQKTNVEFITIHSPQELVMRVWERGVGITQACGSGACAAVVAGVLWKRLQRKVTVHLEGGALQIYWDQESNNVFMTGQATEVFAGDYF